MSANRVQDYLTQEWLKAKGSSGFTVNPLGTTIQPWQAAVYEAAFLQAQKDNDKAPKDFPWAENWN